MAGLDAIWKRAREDLILDARQGAADEYLWEHSDRVARNARLIGRLPVVQAERPVSQLGRLLIGQAGTVTDNRTRYASPDSPNGSENRNTNRRKPTTSQT